MKQHRYYQYTILNKVTIDSWTTEYQFLENL